MENKQTAVEWQFEQLFNSFEKFNNGKYTFPTTIIKPELFKELIEGNEKIEPIEDDGLESIDAETLGDGVEDVFMDACSQYPAAASGYFSIKPLVARQSRSECTARPD